MTKKGIMKVLVCLVLLVVTSTMPASAFALTDNTTSVSGTSARSASEKVSALQADQEVKFNGTAIEYFSSTGTCSWNVRVDTIISGPSGLQGHTVTVALWSGDSGEFPSGHMDPEIEPGDSVGVYGLYVDEDYVTLSGSEAYCIDVLAAGDPTAKFVYAPPDIFANDTYLIPLYTGWNLISLPLMPNDTDVLDVMSSVAGNWNSIWSYEPGNWKRYDLTGPIFLNELTIMEPGKGYWIDMKSEDTLAISGTEPTVKSIPLSAGVNLVGYYSLSSMPTTSAMSSVAGNWNSVWSYKDGAWERYDLTGPDFLDDLTIMEPGKGYWLDMKSPDTWTLGA